MPHFSPKKTQIETQIENHLAADCQNIIDIINVRVLQSGIAFAAEAQAKAFSIKMVGDYYCYIIENPKYAKFEEVKDAVKAAYEEAKDIDVVPCNPI